MLKTMIKITPSKHSDNRFVLTDHCSATTAWEPVAQFCKRSLTRTQLVNRQYELFIYVPSIAAFPWHRRWVVATMTTWPTSQKYLLSGLLRMCRPLYRETKIRMIKRFTVQHQGNQKTMKSHLFFPPHFFVVVHVQLSPFSQYWKKITVN